MKKLIIILIFLTTPLFAAKVERLGFYNIQELLEDDNLTYKIIRSYLRDLKINFKRLLKALLINV